MVTLKTLDSSILSLIILIFIYFSAYDRSEKEQTSYKLFIALVQFNIIIIIVDILGWVFNGLPGSLNLSLNKSFNVLLYILVPVGPMIWTLYSDYQVFYSENRTKKLMGILAFLFGAHGVSVILNIFLGYYFSIDNMNVYHRGDFYWVHVLFCYLFPVYSLVSIIKNRKNIEMRNYVPMLLFVLPISLGGIIQVFFYGVSTTWLGMMLSLLIIYFNIQDRALNTDYLTGVYNRRCLERYVKTKIENSTAEKTFSAILIDLDKFKQINDKYGHDVGDKALMDTISIIKNSINKNDFIGRFGGDEFYIISDIHDKASLELTIKGLKENLDDFNKNNKNQYKLSFSIGYDVYDFKSKLQSNGFFKHIDMLMYHNKN